MGQSFLSGSTRKELTKMTDLIKIERGMDDGAESIQQNFEAVKTAIDPLLVPKATLWTGSNAMGSDATITLSKSPAQCRNGIILWFKYTSGDGASASQSFVINKEWFVGKTHEGVSFSLSRAFSTTMQLAGKYVYISEDGTMTGHTNNTSGINNPYVLTEIDEF